MNGSGNYRAVFVSGGHVFQPVSIMKMVVTGREKSPPQALMQIRVCRLTTTSSKQTKANAK
jgi:hypothetical protein